uniref:Uncharacterized protein n=1 Tax=Panagrolaimus sp. PS1159 TaxID=55785 RepID=A0AC35GK02_9BILA
MSTSSHISLTSISAISGGAAYLTFSPRNNLSSLNILGRKIAVGVMVSGAIGWIIYWSFNKKPVVKKKNVLPNLTTIRERQTSKKTSSSSKLLPSAPSIFLPTQEIFVPKTEAPAKIIWEWWRLYTKVKRLLQVTNQEAVLHAKGEELRTAKQRLQKRETEVEELQKRV